jgi:hypothetical protein
LSHDADAQHHQNEPYADKSERNSIEVEKVLPVNSCPTLDNTSQLQYFIGIVRTSENNLCLTDKNSKILQQCFIPQGIAGITSIVKSMKTSRTIQLFLSLGLSAGLIACNGTPPTDGTASPGAESSPSADHGGEGGEGGEGATTTSTDADIDFMAALGLMKGHLLVAKELLQAKNYTQAEPHIGHPVEEIYADIEQDLARLNVAPFKENLNALHGLIKTTPDSPEVNKKFDQAIKDIDGAIAAIPEAKRSTAPFVLESINQLLSVAAEEYEAAIVDNKFVEIVEYQDSRGFVLYSNELFTKIQPQLPPERSGAIKTAMDKLKTAWPSVNPPPSPILPPAEISKLVTEIQATSTAK